MRPLYPNFYECVKEARDRLQGTVIIYDEEAEGMTPYYVLSITDHEKDGIFRIYLEPIGGDAKQRDASQGCYNILHNTSSSNPNIGKLLDDWMAVKSQAQRGGIVRKHMNSPYFNYFRPFPLGMCNLDERTYYLERQPTRPAMQQGLTQGAVLETRITPDMSLPVLKQLPRPRVIDLHSPEFKDCVLADHHSAHDTLKALLNPNIANEAHAFHREFALVRGPLDTILLAYRTSIIGTLPRNNFDQLNLGKNHKHCREVVEELNLFHTIV